MTEIKLPCNVNLTEVPRNKRVKVIVTLGNRNCDGCLFTHSQRTDLPTLLSSNPERFCIVHPAPTNKSTQ